MRSFAEVSSSQLVGVVWVSLIAGVGITTLFSLVVRWSASSETAHREGRGGAAIVYGGLSVLTLVVFFAGVVLGVHTMLKK
jgi:hypothetical protein